MKNLRNKVTDVLFTIVTEGIVVFITLILLALSGLGIVK